MKNRKIGLFPSWIWPVFLILTIGSVWIRLSVVKTTYEVTQAEKSLRSLQQDREQIELRVAGLRSPRRLEVLARSRFGLTQPQADQVIYPEAISK
ncbi:MAG: septum formation initiator family protein [Bdellovibrionales bacterium]|nr:septum formation initiator family protein [Bdellovibrionales bacterium]